MLHMNKKGFMMAELIVVSAVVLVTLVSFYNSYNKIIIAYNQRLTYYDVTTLYRLGYYRDILKENNILDTVIEQSNTSVVEIYNSKTDTGSIFSLPSSEIPEDVSDIVFMINNKGSKINRDKFAGKNLHITFLEYIDYIEDSVDFSKFDYMMIMERCKVDDENDCNYAYLEIPK